MESSTASVQIPKDLLQPIIDAHLTKALTEALGSKTDILHSAVNKVLTQKVRLDGSTPQYSSDTTISFSDYMIGKVFRDLALECLKESIQGLKEVDSDHEFRLRTIERHSK